MLRKWHRLFTKGKIATATYEFRNYPDVFSEPSDLKKPVRSNLIGSASDQFHRNELDALLRVSRQSLY